MSNKKNNTLLTLLLNIITYLCHTMKRKFKSKADSPLPEFFKRHVEIIKDGKLSCQECGVRLTGSVSEVAHVLPKQYFKSIQVNDQNVIYLCGQFSNNCHAKYDNDSNESIKEMRIFEEVSNRFEYLQEFITEKLNYKHYDRWQV